MKKVIEQFCEIPDTVLIRRILDGERELYEWIIRRYNQRLFRVGMSILGQHAETEDAMQNAYIKAYEHLASFGNRSSFATWLTRIMLNECLAQKKRMQRFIGSMEKHTENSDQQATPAHALMNKELSGVLEDAIAQLPEKYRLVFVLREIEEFSVKETCETLDLEESNVKVRLNRAKTMLKEQLNGYMKDHVYAFHLSRCDQMTSSVLARLEIS